MISARFLRRRPAPRHRRSTPERIHYVGTFGEAPDVPVMRASDEEVFDLISRSHRHEPDVVPTTTS